MIHDWKSNCNASHPNIIVMVWGLCLIICIKRKQSDN